MNWQRVVEEHSGSLRRLVAPRVGSGAVDDVLQETFLRAYRSRHTLDTDRPLEPWLRTIAIRVATDAGARTDSRVDGLAGGLSPDAASEYASAESIALIRKALGLLNPRHRELLEAVALDGATQAAIAKREGVAPEVIRSAVLRARQRFRTVYERLAQEHGLVGVGGSIKPTLTRVRTRLLAVESAIPRKARLTALVVALLAASPALFRPGANAKPPRQESGIDAEQWLSPISERWPGAPERIETRRIDIGTNARHPAGQWTGDVGTSGLGTLNTSWRLRVEPLWLEVTVGTDGDQGRLGVRIEQPGANRSNRTEASVNTDCNAGMSASSWCGVSETVEQRLRDLHDTN